MGMAHIHSKSVLWFMKLLYGNGTVLEARDVGPVLVRFRARKGGPPIKFNRWAIMSDENAREELEAVRATGLYKREV
jgi:hypothetical protein